MVVIQNIDSSTFRFNNLKYIKNFIVIKQGVNNISIHNGFDTSLLLLTSTPFNQIQVDGIVYGSQSALMDKLAPLVFAKGTGQSNLISPSISGTTTFQQTYQQTDNNIIKVINDFQADVVTIDKNGFIKAKKFQVDGGLGTQFLKADGSTDSTKYSTLGDVTGAAGTIARFKSGGGLDTSQISESAGFVTVGGSGSYTEKFEVIGNVKANNFIGSGSMLTGLNKSMVGLGNVDNTSDINKPVSTATQSALNLKANIASPTFTGVVGGITKSMVGLSNVDNTSDINKPVSNPTQAALNLKANIASPSFSWLVNVDTTSLSPQNAITVTNDTSIVASIEKNGFIKATRFEKIGGLGTQFLKADGSTDSTTYSTLGDVTGAAGTIARFKSGGGLDTSQITESAGMVVIGGAGSYTEKFEVIGGIKATKFVGSGAELNSITKGQVGLGNVDNTADASKSVNYANIAGSSTNTTRIQFGDGPRTLSDRLPNTLSRSVNFDFVNASVIGGTGNYGGVMTFTPWDGTSTSTGDSSYQLGFNNETGINGSGNGGLKLRKGIDSTWGSWTTILSSANFNSYSPTLAGGGATGTWGININGNANYATTAGSAPANGGTSAAVTINYNNDSNSTYQMLWGSGNGVYGTGGIYCNPATDTLYTNGDVVAYAASDERLKDNIKPIPNAIDKISKIGGYSFDWNDKQEVYTGNDIGVIAQEIEAVLPQLVITRDNGYKAVKYDKLIALLIQGMKEQQEEINNLKKVINK